VNAKPGGGQEPPVANAQPHRNALSQKGPSLKLPLKDYIAHDSVGPHPRKEVHAKENVKYVEEEIHTEKGCNEEQSQDKEKKIVHRVRFLAGGALILRLVELSDVQLDLLKQVL
jgi:hypothetical protein